MKHKKTQRFHEAFGALPSKAKRQAKKQLALFEEDPSAPAFAMEPIDNYPGVWSARINDEHRFTFEFEDDGTGGRVCVYRVIGDISEVHRTP